MLSLKNRLYFSLFATDHCIFKKCRLRFPLFLWITVFFTNVVFVVSQFFEDQCSFCKYRLRFPLFLWTTVFFNNLRFTIFFEDYCILLMSSSFFIFEKSSLFSIICDGPLSSSFSTFFADYCIFYKYRLCFPIFAVLFNKYCLFSCFSADHCILDKCRLRLHLSNIVS